MRVSTEILYGRGSKWVIIFSKLKFLEDGSCSQVCTKEYNVNDKDTKRKLDFLLEGIKKNYQHHWIIDNMPVTWCYNIESNRQYCNRGFPIGCYIDPKGRKSEGCYLSREALWWHCQRL
ncbi:transmembrane 9 superfamily member 2-like [Artemia franciscana]|uniref:transmembrane 9 superfamily member 2-like n=1 Tax=Artemia franciscana TaxID=6661 RepID=UPI0032DA5ED6